MALQRTAGTPCTMDFGTRDVAIQTAIPQRDGSPAEVQCPLELAHAAVAKMWCLQRQSGACPLPVFHSSE